MAGSPGAWGSTDGASSAARFSNPRGVAVDRAGNVFVADYGSNVIRKVSSAGVVATLAVGFSGPTCVAVDDAGTVFVADTGNNAVRKVSSVGVVTTLTGRAGYAGGAARFRHPYGVAVDSDGTVFVADTFSHVIRKVTRAGLATILAGSAGVPGSADGPGSAARFNEPCGVALDGVGNLFVADTYSNTIRKVTPTGLVSTLAGSTGEPGSADGTGSAARFSAPYSVAVDSAGVVFVADQGNGTIRRVSPGGEVTTLAGSAGNPGSADGTGSGAQFQNPFGVALDGAGNVYVADGSNHTIRKVTAAGVVTTLAGSAGDAGSADGAGGAARFTAPCGVAVDSAGNVIVVETYGGLRKVTPAGVVSTLPSVDHYGYSGAAVDGEGNVYVADFTSSRIRKLTPAGVVTTLSGSAENSGNADGLGGASRFHNPCGVAVDSAGGVLVADTWNALIRKVTPAGEVTTLAGSGDWPPASSDGTGSAARFYDPMSVAIDNAGNTLVADHASHTLRKVTPAGGVTTLAGSAGSPGSANGTGSAARFNDPYGVAVDSVGTIFVADKGNHTIRKVTPAGLVTTLAGSAGNAGSANGSGSVARFNSPTGVAVDGAGNVFVADNGNHTLRKVTPAGVVTTLAGTPDSPGDADGTGSAARFFYPTGVTVDNAGNLFVADAWNNTIRRVTSAGVVTTIGGTPGLVGSADGVGGAAGFANPSGITVDSAGTLYVADADNNRVSKGTLSAPPTVQFELAVSSLPENAGVALVSVTLAEPCTNTVAIAYTTADGTPSTGSGPGGATAGSDYIATRGTLVFAPGVTAAAITIPLLDDSLAESAETVRITLTPEFQAPLSMLLTITDEDTDADGLADDWEMSYWSSLSLTSSSDPDGDGFSNAQEYAVGTSPKAADSAPVYSWTHFVGQPGSHESGAVRFNQPCGVAVDAAGNVYVAATYDHVIQKVTPTGVVTILAGSPGNVGSADGTGSAARFSQPYGVALDAAGNLLVADFGNHTIRKVTPAGVVTTLAGSPGEPGSADGIDGAARFRGPIGVALDPAGNVVVADYDNHTIRKVSPAGAVTTLAGSPGNPGSADGIGGAAQFFLPVGVAGDSAGNLFVTDGRNGTIRKVTPAGVVTTLADGAGSAARFANPGGVAVDSAGNLFVALVWGGTIRKVTPAGVVTTLAGMDGVAGSADGTGSDARFDEPCGVALNSEGNLVVADTQNGTIRKVTPAGVVTTLTGRAGYAGGAARFHVPCGLAVDRAGNVFVTETYNQTIRRVTPAGLVTTLAGNPGYPGSADGAGSAARFNFPWGLTVDSAGNLFVADRLNCTIRRVTPAGDVTTLAGNPGNPGSADGTGGAARFGGPVDVAVDGAGNVFVADHANSTIRKVTPAGVVTTLAGSAGIYGSADGTGSEARFSAPCGVAVDSAGIVYVADTNNHTVRKVTQEGVVTTLAGSAGVQGGTDGTGSEARLNFPGSLALDSAGNLLVEGAYGGIRKVTPAGVVTTLTSAVPAGVLALDSAGNILLLSQNVIRRVTPEGMVTTTLAGRMENSGSADGTGSAARFYNPLGVAVDPAGNVWVADTWNALLRKVTPAGLVTTLAGYGGWPLGSADGTGSAGRFHWPVSVAVDSSGNAFVADNTNHTLRKVTPEGVVTTLAGSAGSPGTANGTGSAARFNQPYGVALDSAGTIFVADNGNHTIRKVTQAGVVTTLAGSPGSAGSANGTGSAARFSSPTGVAVDSAGNVVVADNGNHTIRTVTSAGVVTTLAGSAGIPGEADGTGSAARFFYPTGVAVDSAGNVFVADAWNNTIRMITPASVVTTIGGTPGLVGEADGVGPAAGFANPCGIAADGSGALLVADADNNRLSRGVLIYPPPLVQFEIAATSVPETAGTLVVTVTLSGPSPQTITLDYATLDGTATVGSGDYEARSGTLTFAPGETSQTITIPLLDDGIAESAEAFQIVFSNPVNAALPAPSSLLVTLVDSVLTVTAPAGGERWRQGMTRAVTWTSSGDDVENVRIELLCGGAPDRVLVASTPNTGSWDWNLPIDLEGALDYRIRVSSTATPAITATSAGDCPFAADWYGFHHDPQHSGRSPFVGPAAPVLKWAFATGGLVSSSPALGPDGTIYCGSGDGSIYALNPDGTRKWAFPTGDTVAASPAVGPDGTIYCGSDDGKVYALNPDGTQKWAFTTGQQVYSSAVVGADGTVYVGSLDCHLYALRPDGTQKWAFTVGPAGATRLRVSSPALGADGTIYVGSCDWDVGGGLFAVNPDGTQKWAFVTAGTTSPTVGADGTIYAGARSATGDTSTGFLMAVNPNGTEKWRFTTAGTLDTTPALGADGTIYYLALATLYAVHPDGTQKWAVPGGATVYWTGSPAVDADGTIYMAGGNWTLTALRPDGTEKGGVVISTSNHVSSSPAIAPDGTIYFGGWSGSIYAIGNQPPPSLAGSTPPSGALVTALPSLQIDLAYYTDVYEAGSTVTVTRDGAAYTAFSRDDSVEKRIVLTFQPAPGLGLYAITVTPRDLNNRAGAPATLWIRVVAALGGNVFYADAAAPTGRTPAQALDPATPLRTLTTLLASPYVVAGDTVRVTAGTYSASATGETFPLVVRDGLTLSGAGMAATTLDAQHSARVLSLGSGAVSGFTLTGGTATDGAGVRTSGANARLTLCRVVGNAATGTAGGILVDGGAAVLGGNLIELNTAPAGGAVVVRGGASASLLNNTLVRNQGGAVLLAAGAPATRLANNLLAWNAGPAIAESDTASDALIEFNLFWGNDSVYRDEGATEFASVALAQAVVPQITHNIEGDPRLADPNGPDDDPLTWPDNDWHLTDVSPCLNAGVGSPLLPALELDGEPRIRGSVPDIGADEHAIGSTAIDVVIPATEEVTDDFSSFSVNAGVRLSDLALAISGNRPIAVARRGADRIWIANDYADSLTRLDGSAHDAVSACPLGAFFSRGVCVDTEGNVWVSHYYDHSVTKLTPTGAIDAGFPVSVGTNPLGMAAGRLGDVWVANEGSNTVHRLSAAGATLASVPLAGKPQYLAVDRRGNVWVTCADDNAIRRLDPSGAAAGTFPVGSQPSGIAVDLYGNVWVTNTGSGSVTKLDENGAPQLGGAIAVGAEPRGIAGDATGFVWVVLSGAGQVVRLAQDGTITARHAVSGSPYAYGDLAGLAVESVVRDSSPPTAPGTPLRPAALTRLLPVRFTWSAASEPDGTLAGYEVQAGTAPGAADRFEGVVGDRLSWDVTGTHGDVLYARVRAWNTSGTCGPWSASSAGVGIDSAGPTLVSRSPSAEWVTTLASLTLTLTDDRGTGALAMPASLASLVVRRNGVVLSAGSAYQATNQGSGRIQILLTPPAAGLCEVEVTAADDLGNTRLIRQAVYDDDTANPAVVATSPTAGATAVPVGSAITVDFSEAVAAASVTSASFALVGNAQTVPGTFAVAYGRVTFTPASALAPGVIYVLTLSDGITDPGGHRLAAAPVVRSFSTGDTSISIQDLSVDEAAGAAVLTVTKAGTSQGEVRVNVATADGTPSTGSGPGGAQAPGDYAVTSGQLVWPSGDTSAKSLSVPVTDDALDEGDETFTVTLSGASGLAAIAGSGVATVTVRDNDVATVSVADVVGGEVQGSVTVTVTKNGASAGSVRVSYATANATAIAPADYTGTSGSLQWNDGQSGPRTFTVPLVADGLAEPAETFLVRLSALTGNAVLGNAEATVTVADSDATLSVNSAYGAPTPPVGVTRFVAGSSVTASVPGTPVAGPDGVRYTVRGWAGTGDVPTSGSSASTGAFVLQQASSVTWQWQTQVRLTATAGVNGTVGVDNPGDEGWYDLGTAVHLTATPDAFTLPYRFERWSGDVPAAQETSNPLLLSLEAPHALAAVFVDNDTDGDGLADDWEQFYFRSDADPLDDPDRDSFNNLCEFRDRTDPLDKASFGTGRSVNTASGHAYRFYAGALSWDQAQEDCALQGGHLTTIADEAENTVAYGQVAAGVAYAWIGGNLDRLGSWRWVTGEAWNFSKWRSGEPSATSGRDFAGMVGPAGSVVNQRKWSALTNSGAPVTGYLCEWDHAGDVDADGLADTWEMRYFGNLLPGPGDDPDGDNLTNLREQALNSNPAQPDPSYTVSGVAVGGTLAGTGGSLANRSAHLVATPDPSPYTYAVDQWLQVLPGNQTGLLQTGGASYDTPLLTADLEVRVTFRCVGGAPAPNPLTWQTAPHVTAGSASAVSMAVVAATHPLGVEYRFDLVGPGTPRNSGWIATPEYEFTGLSPDTLYTFEARARNRDGDQVATQPTPPAQARTGVPPTPTLEILEPDGIDDFPASDLSFTISWRANSELPATVTFYLDNDNLGYPTLSQILTPTTFTPAASGQPQSTTFSALGLADGQYYVWAALNDTYHPAVRAYSPGPFLITRQATARISCELLSASSLTYGRSVRLRATLLPAVAGPVSFAFRREGAGAGELPIEVSSQSSGLTGMAEASWSPDRTGRWEASASWPGNTQYSPARSASVWFTVTPATAQIELVVPRTTMALGRREVGGLLSIAEGNDGVSLAGKQVALTVQDPTGARQTLVAACGAAGQFSQTVDFAATGVWSVRAEFPGTEDLLAGGPTGWTQISIVQETTYLILCQGADASSPHEGLDAHAQTLATIYAKSRGVGLDAEDINYLTFWEAGKAPERDGTPTEAALETAITDWASARMNAAPAPLYIVLVNHGSIGAFHIDRDILTPSDLRRMLDRLQNVKLTDPVAKQQKVVVILGACHSGSFIRTLSADKRIVIASADTWESSYRGASQAGELNPDGEYFVSSLFQELTRSDDSLFMAFQTAATAARERAACTVPVAPPPAPVWVQDRLQFQHCVEYVIANSDNTYTYHLNSVARGSQGGVPKPLTHIVFGLPTGVGLLGEPSSQYNHVWSLGPDAATGVSGLTFQAGGYRLGAQAGVDETEWFEFTLGARLDPIAVGVKAGASVDSMSVPVPVAFYDAETVRLGGYAANIVATDNSQQHPLLEDDGDGKGSHTLTGNSGDGLAAQGVFFGRQRNAAGDLALLRATESVCLSPTDPAPELWAAFNHRADDVSAAWIEVKPPGFGGAASDGTLQFNMNLAPLMATGVANDPVTGLGKATWTPADDRGSSYNPALLAGAGLYQVLYYAQQSGASDAVSGRYSWVCRASGLATPAAFALLTPAADETIVAPAAFTWEPSPSGAGPVQYLFRLWRDGGQADLYYEAPLASLPLAALDHKLLPNGEYWWEVIAVDLGGNTRRSELRQVLVNTPNSGAINMLLVTVYDQATRLAVPGATLTINGAAPLSLASGACTRSLALGLYTLRVSAGGQYAEQTRQVNLAGGINSEEFALQATGTQVTLSLQRGWNLVSLPIQPYDNVVAEVLRISGTDTPAYRVVYGWNGATFYPATTLDALHGYWVFCPEDCRVAVRGQVVQPARRAMEAGWQLVGASTYWAWYESHTVALTCLGWTGAGYRTLGAQSDPSTDLMVPGAGYWLYLDAPAEVQFGP
jgi:outer membrane protein assembly factor BamB